MTVKGKTMVLARALVREPRVFLLDEPLSNLDAIIRDAARTDLKKLFRELGAMVIYVTHDQTEAMTMSDLIIVMEKGRIRQTGDPDTVYRNPAHRFVAEFISPFRINLIPGKIKDRQFISLDGSVVFAAGLEKCPDVLAGVRPEHLSLGTGGEAILKGRVGLIEPMGANRLISVRIGEWEMKPLSSSAPGPNEPVSLSLALRDVLLFDAGSGLRLRPQE